MDPLLKKVLLQLLGFTLLISLSTLLFVLVENTEKNDAEVKYHLLHSLFQSMESKYNMSLEEFNNFSNMAFKGLSEPKPQWNYFNAMDFVMQTVSTIGKKEKQQQIEKKIWEYNSEMSRIRRVFWIVKVFVLNSQKLFITTSQEFQMNS